MAPFSVRPPVHSTTVSSPWAASTEIACSTLARQDAVENGRTMPVVPRIEMPPMMPSLALVVLRAIRSPSGTEMITVTPLVPRSTASPTAWVIIARGTGLMAGPPSSSPRPGLVTTPTPTPPSSSRPGWPRQRTVAVSRAPWVTSGSSPASLTTTAIAWLLARACTRPRGSGPAGRTAGRPPRCVASRRVASAVVAALAAADAQVPVVQPVRSAFFRTLAVRGRSGSRSSGSGVTWCPWPRGAASWPGVRPCGSRGSGRGGTGANGCPRPPGPGRPAPACASRACAV